MSQKQEWRITLYDVDAADMSILRYGLFTTGMRMISRAFEPEVSDE